MGAGLPANECRHRPCSRASPLIWTPPGLASEVLLLTLEDLAAVLYPACGADGESAGPDGIRRESPHLLEVLEGHAVIQVILPVLSGHPVKLL